MKKINRKDIIIDLLVIAVAFAVFFIISNYIALPIRVEGKSMEDTIKEKDIGFSFYYDLDNINRFDIVVVKNEEGKKLFKRVIGLPNEKIEYKNNQLFVDDKKIEEDFLDGDIYTNDFSVLLKDDEVFCLGDNRPVSNDSRSYGPFKVENIVSSHAFIIFPFSEAGFKK